MLRNRVQMVQRAGSTTGLPMGRSRVLVNVMGVKMSELDSIGELFCLQ